MKKILTVLATLALLSGCANGTFGGMTGGPGYGHGASGAHGQDVRTNPMNHPLNPAPYYGGGI
ncbi:MAG TPA: hypothetical protein VM406_01955 [Noviherbaspirillum sp.]|nr:hypothetical protein [Noviherbaspirillum sp.]